MHRHLTLPVFLTLSCFVALTAPAAWAQVVIEERVEIAPEAAAKGQYDYQPRGKGEYVFYGLGASSTGEPLGGTFSVATSEGGVHSTSITSGFQFDSEYVRGVCSGVEYYHRNYTNPNYDTDLLRVEVGPTEEVDSLWFARGGEVDVKGGIAPTSQQTYEIGCGYRWTNRCWCLTGRTYPNTGATIRGRFEADPPDRLALSVDRDPISFQVPGQEATSLRAIAVYSTGEQAPLADSTKITFSENSWLGQLHDIVTGEVGSQITVDYGDIWPGGGRLYFDTMESPLEEGPLCGTGVRVLANGGGVGGEIVLSIAGTGPPPASDTLVAIVSPWEIKHGESATVSARHNVTGCGGEMPDSTLLSVGVGSVLYGSLEYDGQRGQSIFSVPYGDLKDGLVKYIMDGESIPNCERDIDLWVSGDGLRGKTTLTLLPQQTQQRPQHPTETSGIDGESCPDGTPADLVPKSEIDDIFLACGYTDSQTRDDAWEANVRKAFDQISPLTYHHLVPPNQWGRELDGAAFLMLRNGQIDQSRITVLIEAKYGEDFPFISFSQQGGPHIDILAQSYEGLDQAIDAPIYIIATLSKQNLRNVDHQYQLLPHADQKNVLVYHHTLYKSSEDGRYILRGERISDQTIATLFGVPILEWPYWLPGGDPPDVPIEFECITQ